ncbi:hypothetical protein UW163_17790 (plasmid) [Ralstonia solanacearum]|uniref:Uncharacterized protein n=1 Tax=Ralstonia solanacearum TaxID=305 RepID=A0A5H2Q6L4_RALSL|nr:hypothetical protein UW163_17790 [Ralstonia solanacearum]AMP76693.1 hypothetical protein RALBFv3_21375 [Ralstonia solanacearum]AYB63273.1 hypothetical protein C2124_22770 [Ralstonia solanacearum]
MHECQHLRRAIFSGQFASLAGLSHVDDADIPWPLLQHLVRHRKLCAAGQIDRYLEVIDPACDMARRAVIP